MKILKKKNLKITSGIALFILTAAFLAGCQQSGTTADNVSKGTEKSGLVSSSGIKAESLIPADTMIVVKVGTDSESQQKNLDTLKKNFPPEMWQAWDTEFKQVTLSLDKSFDTSLENDILPLFGDHPQVLVAINSMPLPTRTQQTTLLGKSPDITMIAPVKDKDGLTKLLNSKINESKRKSYKDWTIYNPEKDAYIAMTQDIAVYTTTEERMQQSLDSSATAGTSLLTNDRYQKLLAKVPNENLFYYFIDMPSYSKWLLQSLQSSQDESAPSSIATPMPTTSDKRAPGTTDDVATTPVSKPQDNSAALENLKNYFNSIEGEIITASAEEKGIRFNAYVDYDQAKMKASGYDINSVYQPAYLYKKVPGDNMIMYAESANLKQVMAMVQQTFGMMMATQPGIEGNFDEASKQVNDFLTQQGLDGDKDILSFMDKGYAMAFQSNDDVTKFFPVPSFGLYVDASSNADGAKKTMQKMYEMLNLLLAQAKMGQPDIADMIKHEKNENDKGTYYSLKIDLQKMPAKQKTTVPAQFADILNMPIEAYYGVMKDNLAVFSFMYPKFDQGGYKTLAENTDFTKAMDDIKGYDRSVVYFNMTALVNYMDTYMSAMAKFGGVSEIPAEYKTFKDWSAPVKSLIFAGSKTGDNEMSMEGFMRIEK